MFTDGCCYKGGNGNVASYAVVQQVYPQTHFTVEAQILPQPASAQLAELWALVRAIELSKGKSVNIYTDSANAYAAVHIDGPQWQRRGFVTSQNTPVKHAEELKHLMESVKLPKQLAVMKCKGHSKLDNSITKGNDAADQAAKHVGGYKKQMICISTDTQTELKEEQIAQLQLEAGPYEHQQWTEKGATQNNGLWRAHDGRIVAPAKLCSSLIRQAHEPSHVGKK